MGLLKWLKNCCMWLMRGIGWPGAASAALALCVAGGSYVHDSARLEQANDHSVFLANAIARLDMDIEEVKFLRDAVAALLVRRQVVEQFHVDRLLPVKLLDQIARLRPEGVYFGAMNQTGGRVRIDGFAAGYEEVAALVGKLGESPLFLAPQLLEVRTENTSKAAAYPVKFSLGVFLRGREKLPETRTMNTDGIRPGDPR